MKQKEADAIELKVCEKGETKQVKIRDTVYRKLEKFSKVNGVTPDQSASAILNFILQRDYLK
ncbi:MAG: hypothetical protein WAX69_15315 [Victivallales bacterium]